MKLYLLKVKPCIIWEEVKKRVYNDLIYLSKLIPRYYEIFCGVFRSLTLPINYEKIKVTVATAVRELEGMLEDSRTYVHIHTHTHTPHYCSYNHSAIFILLEARFLPDSWFQTWGFLGMNPLVLCKVTVQLSICLKKKKKKTTKYILRKVISQCMYF